RRPARATSGDSLAGLHRAARSRRRPERTRRVVETVGKAIPADRVDGLRHLHRHRRIRRLIARPPRRRDRGGFHTRRDLLRRARVVALASSEADVMLRVALTGNVASGKSAVADVWERLGAKVVDADVLARRAVEPGTAALARIER